MSKYRYEVHEQCFTFNSCRLIHKTDSEVEAISIKEKWQQEHNDRKYYIIDKHLDADGMLIENELK